MSMKKIHIGDYVKIKDDIAWGEEDHMVTKDWGGTVTELYDSDDMLLVRLDATSLQHAGKEYAIEAFSVGADPTEYRFFFDDVYPAKARHTPAENESAAQELLSLENEFLDIFDEGELPNEALVSILVEDFIESSEFENLEIEKQTYSEVIIRSFLDLMFEKSDGTDIEDWDVDLVRETCLNWAPNDVPAGIELYEHYGDNVIALFRFWDNDNPIPDAKPYIDAVEEIKSQIPINAAKEENWSLEKQAFMKSGLDIAKMYLEGNSEDLDDFGEEGFPFDSFALPDFSEPQYPKASFDHDPYRHLNRNDRISVKYTDGKLAENVKFKKVEQDIRNGECKIVSD